MPSQSHYQRKLGSNTSVLRTNRIVTLDLDEGWCETLHYITIHHKRIYLDEGRCETLHHITIDHKRIDLDEGRCETLHHTTIPHKRIDLDEGRCETLHYITIHHKRIDLDEGRCETLHHITIHHKRIDEGRCETLHYITIHHKRIDLDEGRCVTLHYIAIHHRRIDLDEGRCETLHHITIHHKRIDEGRCETLHYIKQYITKELTCMNVAWGLCWGGSRSTKPCVFLCKVAAAGDERYLVCAAVAAAVFVVPSMCFATSGCSCVRSSMRFLKLWLQIALEWLHECCMGYVLGRKPEHETLRFSV